MSARNRNVLELQSECLVCNVELEGEKAGEYNGLDTAVVDADDEDVFGADLFELVHDGGDVGLEDHGRDCVPVLVLERRDGGDFQD